MNQYYFPTFTADDAWQQVHGGFRMDWHPGTDDTITFQGDYYNGYSGEEATFPWFHAPDYAITEPNTAHVSGDNVPLELAAGAGRAPADWTLLAYYDQTQRDWMANDYARRSRTRRISTSSIASPWESGTR